MIEARRLLRLPAARFDGAEDLDVTYGPLGFEVTGTFETFPTSEYSWRGRLLGGPDRTAWPIAFSLGMMAQWRGLSQLAWLASEHALSDPRRAVSTPAGPVARPRAVVYSAGNFAAGDVEDIVAAVEAGIAQVQSQMEAKGVLAARAPELDFSFGSGFLGARFPNASAEAFEVEFPAVSLTLYGVLPVYEPDDWLAGEVLYISVSYTQDEEFPFGTMAFGATPTYYDSLLELEVALWESVHPRHSRVRHHVVYLQAPSGEPDPFDADRLAGAQVALDAVADLDVTMTAIQDTLASGAAAITADVAAVITEFFGL